VSEKDRKDYDSPAKDFYTKYFVGLKLNAEKERQVWNQARGIDVVVHVPENMHYAVQDTAFDYFKEYNALELKVYDDTLDIEDYMLIQSRLFMLAAELNSPEIKKKTGKEIFPKKHLTLTILCTVKPVKILTTLHEQFGYSPIDESGFYLYQAPYQTPDYRIIVPNEVDIIERNYPILMLTKGQKRIEVAKHLAIENKLYYLNHLIILSSPEDNDIIMNEEVVKMCYEHPQAQNNLFRLAGDIAKNNPQAQNNLLRLVGDIAKDNPEFLDNLPQFAELKKTLEQERQKRQTLEEKIRLLETQQKNG